MIKRHHLWKHSLGEVTAKYREITLVNFFEYCQHINTHVHFVLEELISEAVLRSEVERLNASLGKTGNLN